MRKVVLQNVLMNIAIGTVFVFLNNSALQRNLEETFVSLALLYSVVVILANAFYISLISKK